MFNYIGANAEIHNLVIQNGSFIGDYAAALAVHNYGLIEDCTIADTSVQGGIMAGGMVVYNEGTITNYSNKTTTSTGTYGNGVFVNNTNVQVITNTSGLNVAAAGLAVLNNGNIKNVSVTGSEEYSISIMSNGNTINTSYLGGISAFNYGSIKNAYVSFVTNSEGIKTNGNFYAIAGGIAGTTQSTIEDSFASVNISLSLTNSSSVAGGVVGEILGIGEINNTGYYGNNKIISAYNAGGIAGLLNQSLKRKIALDGWDATWGNAKFITSKEQMGTGIRESFVDGSVIIKGERVGGLVVDLTSGAILDSYVGSVTLTGNSSSSEVANLALKATASTKDKDDNGNFTTGIIAYCFSNASFNNSGTSYGVSGNDILEAVAIQVEKKTSAFGVAVIVSKSKTSGTKFYGEGWPIYNWFKDGQYNCKTSDGDMYPSDATSNKYTNFGFSTSIWSFDVDQLGRTKVGNITPILSNSIIDTASLNID